MAHARKDFTIDSNQLIGGAWQRADGSRTVYHHGSKATITAVPSQLRTICCSTSKTSGKWSLSAQSFAALIGNQPLAKVEERSATYVLSFETGRTIGASRLIKSHAHVEQV